MLIVWGGEIVGLGDVFVFCECWQCVDGISTLSSADHNRKLFQYYDSMETACVDVAEHKHTYRTVILKAVASCID